MSEYEFDKFLRITNRINCTPNTCSFDHELINEISMIPKKSETPKKDEIGRKTKHFSDTYIYYDYKRQN